MQTKARSLIPVPLPPGFEKTDEKKVILSGVEILKKLVYFDEMMETKAHAEPARYETECADFHRFVKSVIPQIQKGERIEVRAVGIKRIPKHGVYRFCAYCDPAGKEHYFSVHSSCFSGYRLRDLKKHERRYNPSYEQVVQVAV